MASERHLSVILVKKVKKICILSALNNNQNIKKTIRYLYKILLNFTEKI